MKDIDVALGNEDDTAADWDRLARDSIAEYAPLWRAKLIKNGFRFPPTMISTAHDAIMQQRSIHIMNDADVMRYAIMRTKLLMALDMSADDLDAALALLMSSRPKLSMRVCDPPA